MNELTVVFDLQEEVFLVLLDNNVRNVQHNTVGYLRDHCCSANTTMHSVCVVELQAR